jgi:hypothetical protein
MAWYSSGGVMVTRFWLLMVAGDAGDSGDTIGLRADGKHGCKRFYIIRENRANYQFAFLPAGLAPGCAIARHHLYCQNLQFKVCTFGGYRVQRQFKALVILGGHVGFFKPAAV